MRLILQGSWICEITTSQHHMRIHFTRLQVMHSCLNPQWFGRISIMNLAAFQCMTVIGRLFIHSPAKCFLKVSTPFQSVSEDDTKYVTKYVICQMRGRPLLFKFERLRLDL